MNARVPPTFPLAVALLKIADSKRYNSSHQCQLIARAALSDSPASAARPAVTEDDLARRIFNDEHRGLQNCYDWDTAGLEDEHPGTIDRYYGYARSALALFQSAPASMNGTQGESR